MSGDTTPKPLKGGLSIPATGNALKTSTSHDTWLRVTAGPSGNLAEGSPEVEVHLGLLEDGGDEYAEGWFRVSDLEAAIAAARSAQ
jgi:hypothetical protein